MADEGAQADGARVVDGEAAIAGAGNDVPAVRREGIGIVEEFGDLVPADGRDRLAPPRNDEVRKISGLAVKFPLYAEVAGLQACAGKLTRVRHVLTRNERRALCPAQGKDDFERPPAVRGAVLGNLTEGDLAAILGVTHRKHRRAGSAQILLESAGGYVPEVDFVVQTARRDSHPAIRRHGGYLNLMVVTAIEIGRFQAVRAENRGIKGRKAGASEQRRAVWSEAEVHERRFPEGLAPYGSCAAPFKNRDFARVGGDGEFVPDGRSGKAIDVALKLVADPDKRADVCAPEHDAAVVARCREPPAIPGKSDPVDVILVPGEQMQSAMRCHVPENGALVEARRCQELAIGREGKREDRVAMAWQQGRHRSGAEIVNADRVVSARRALQTPRRREPAAIGRNCHRQDLAGLAFADFTTDRADRFARGKVPDPYDLVVGHRNQVLAIGCEQNRPDESHMAACVEAQDGAGLRARPKAQRDAGADQCQSKQKRTAHRGNSLHVL